MARSLALLVVTTATLAARAHASPVLAGRVERVVAVGDGVAVLRAGQALLLDGAGNVIGRCGSGAALAGRARRADGTTLPAERVLREAGFRDDDDSPEAEALLDDEGIEGRRRRRPIDVAAGMPRALSLAGDDGAAWIGTEDGLWRLDAHTAACARAGLAGRTVELVAARAGAVVAVTDMAVWRAAGAGAFEVAGVVSSRPRAIALAGDGTPIVATDDTIVALPVARPPRPILTQPADALVACGADVVALAEDGVYRLGADGRADRLGDRPPARALACLSASSGEPRLLAAGVGAWSTDGGRSWREEAPFLGRSIGAVAFAGGRAWLALQDGAGDGLVVSPGFEDVPAAALPDPRAGLARPAPTRWAWLLPRVSVSFDGSMESRGSAGWRLWLTLTVSLDRRPFVHGPARPEVPLQ
jgi:hypothetical protein